MSNNFETIWETYTSSWKAESAVEKQRIFEESLIRECLYHDPLIKTKDWDSLIEYMLDFHQQIPGGHFVTNYFLAHHNQSIAKWDMKNGDNVIVGTGISYGKYNENGKLEAMTGFFETP